MDFFKTFKANNPELFAALANQPNVEIDARRSEALDPLLVQRLTRTLTDANVTVIDLRIYNQRSAYIYGHTIIDGERVNFDEEHNVFAR